MEKNCSTCRYTDYEGKDIEQELKDFHSKCTLCMTEMVKSKDKQNPPLWEGQE